MNPKISVLMPVYNGEEYLKEAIDSVLAQTLADFELIIINDASTDKSLDVIKLYSDPRIHVINNEVNKGLIASLNIGLEQCRGKYTARLDQDDIALPERLAIQYQFMEENPSIDVVGSWTECINPDGKSIKITRNQTNPWVIRYEFMFNNVMFHSSIFFRTDVIKKNAGYSERFVHSEDYEMYSRPGRELFCANIPQVLFKLRIHNQSITGSVKTQPTVYMNAINVTYRNMTQYIDLTRADFDAVKEVLIIKKPDSKISFHMLIKGLRILAVVTRKFIEQNELLKVDRKLVMRDYRGRRWMMIKHYLIGRRYAFLGK